MEEKHPIMQEKSDFEVLEKQDDHHNQLQQVQPQEQQQQKHQQQQQKQQQQQQQHQQQQHQHQQPKRAMDSKNEEQRRTMETHQSIIKNNGGKDEEESSLDHKLETNKGHEKGVMGPRERLKRHRREVAGQVWIPDMWGQEHFLKDWIDCTAFDAPLVPQNIMLARASLMEEGRRSNSNTLTVENSC